MPNMTYTMATTIAGRKIRIHGLDSIDACIDAWKRERDALGVGASDSGPTFAILRTKKVARIAYNGRVEEIA